MLASRNVRQYIHARNTTALIPLLAIPSHRQSSSRYAILCLNVYLPTVSSLPPKGGYMKALTADSNYTEK